MSDATDQSESKRKFVMEYNAILGDIEVEHKEYESDYIEKQKDKILRLAKILDESGHPKENICSKVCKDVIKYDIKDRHVRRILPDEYKDTKKQRNKEIEQSNRTICGPRTANEQGQKQPLLVGADGQIISTIEEDNRQRDDEETEKKSNPLNEIHGGKSFEQMRRENEIQRQANDEIDEEMEETLENPHNGPQIHAPEPMPLLSNKSPEYRELEARLDEAQDMIRQMAEDRDTALSQAKQAVKQFNQLKGGSMAEELQRFKVENNNLKTILSDVDRTSLEKEGYKEIEVLKLNQDTTRMIQEVSGKSQRTFFLLVHPKTMQIKAAKTDVQMHIVQARRNAGLE